MKILIIGSKGMLGQYLAQVLVEQELILWDKDDLDVTDESMVKEKIAQVKPGVIINCAAYNNVDQAEKESALADKLNGYAVGYLAKVAAEINALLVHISSNYVFSGEDKNGYTENSQPDPISAYGQSKLLGETEISRLAKKYYLIRTSRLFGQTGSSLAAKKTFVDLILDQTQKTQELIGLDEEYDLPTYALDLAQGIKKLINSSLPYGIYHLVNSGEPCTWYSLAKEILAIKKLANKLTPVTSEQFKQRLAKRPKSAFLKNTRLSPLRPWTEALREYLTHNF